MNSANCFVMNVIKGKVLHFPTCIQLVGFTGHDQARFIQLIINMPNGTKNVHYSSRLLGYHDDKWTQTLS